MLQEKRKDLDAEKRKKLVQRLVNELSETQPDFYYKSTSEVAALLHDHIAGGSTLNGDDRALLQPLDRRDIEVLLSHH